MSFGQKITSRRFTDAKYDFDKPKKVISENDISKELSSPSIEIHKASNFSSLKQTIIGEARSNLIIDQYSD